MRYAAFNSMFGNKDGAGRLAVLAAGVLLAFLALSPASDARNSRGEKDSGQEIPFGKAEIRIELNSTDGDAGLQIDLDAEPWRSIRIEDPNGRLIFSVNNSGKLKRLGSTELFMESNEPDFLEDMSLPEILKFLPAGVYDFEGTTIEGKELDAEATLTHDFPCGPEITSPGDGDTVAPGAVLIEWEPVVNKIDPASPTGECTDSTDIEIIGYQVIVDLVGSDPLKRFDIKLPGDATSVTVPSEFIVPGSEYKIEVLAIEESGNQTITEQIFMTSDI